jgi:protoporphyrinogen IX oxidase
MGYLWLKAVHLIGVISWMAGLLYLLRLFVYHAQETSPEVMERLQVMERRLLRAITTPAMVVAVGCGAAMLVENPALLRQPYMHVKLALVAGMLLMHGLASRWRKRLAVEPRFKSHKFFRVMNEIPTLLMIGIVIFIIVRPFAR